MHAIKPFVVMDGHIYFVDRYAAPQSIHLHRVLRVLVEETSRYQHIQIFETEKHGRVLVLDGFPQISESDGWLYTEAMVLPALLAHPNPARVLILGGGDGAAFSFVTRDKRVKSVTLVDLDMRVVELTQEHIPSLWENVRENYGGPARYCYEDALEFLKKMEPPYDIIISDITDPNESESAAHLLGPDFFVGITARLAPEGILAMQSGEKSPGTKTAHDGFLALVAKHFAHRRTGSVHIPWFSADWSFTCARNCYPLPDFTDPSAMKTRLDAHPHLASKLRGLSAGKLSAMFLGAN